MCHAFNITLGQMEASMYKRHQFGVEENPDYIGFVYQFGLKEMRATKHVQYQFRVGTGMYKWAPAWGGGKY